MGDEKVYDSDMYDFLVKNKYIQTADIDKGIYVSLIVDNLYIINYKRRYTTQFVQKSLSGLFRINFPTGYLYEIQRRFHAGNYEIPETNPLNFKNIRGNIVLNEDDNNKMEIQKLLFIFFIVFFPEHQVKKRLNIDCNNDCSSFKKSYIEEFKQYEKYNNKQPEFIDAYINNVMSKDLKYFACYTYLNFLFNKVEDDIEFNKNNKNNKNNNLIENGLNTIKTEIETIIDTFKDRQIYSESDRPTPTYSTLYKRINREFIRILDSDSNKKELQDHNYQYLSGYNIFERKYFIYLFYNYLIKENKTKEISEYKFFQLLKLGYYDFLEQFVTLYMKNTEAKQIVNQFFDNIIKEYENYSKFEDYAETVKKNIILSINKMINKMINKPKQLGGNKSRKRKQKSTRNTRRKPKKHR